MSHTTLPDSITSLITKTNPNDKIAFARRVANLDEWVTSTISPIETQITDLRAKLLPLYDQMDVLKTDAAEFCIHSPELLTVISSNEDGEPETIKCKFCSMIFHIGDE
jgi:hypothetical protein